ncbi:MAG TPA: 2-amino-4-hydroxy-6-hydroxymethyldihydropteridine diphosphokinase [Polyangia bacterium]
MASAHAAPASQLDGDGDDDRPPGAEAYVALGGNLGDRRANLAAAAGALARHPEIRGLVRSALYETVAVADEPQPDYLNGVVRFSTTLPAAALLALCLDIERELGRVRPVGRDKAPRIIDLDLLLCGDAVIDVPGLRLPHPGLLARAFVRIPLADVAAPGLRHPVTGIRLDQADADPDVRRLPSGWPNP